MIELVVGNHDVLLDSGLEFEIIRENPLMNDSGDYSLDIDVNSRCAQNQKIFGPNRINGKFAFDNKPFLLKNDGCTIMAGNVTVLGNSNHKTKIQLLANNSDVHGLFNKDIRIRSMDFGKAPKWTAKEAGKSFGHVYGDILDDGTVVKDSFPLMLDYVGGIQQSYDEKANVTRYGTGTIREDHEIRTQPYLLYYVDKLFTLLGIEVKRNDIYTEKNRRLAMIHGYDTNEYAKMLPDWTVEQFIRELEKFFNCVMDFNTIERSVSIVNSDYYYQDKVYIDDSDVVDEFEYEVEEPVAFQTTYQNVGYKLPSGEYWTLQNISEDILRECDIVEGGSWRDEYDNKQHVLYYHEGIDEFFIHYENEDMEKTFLMVQQFCEIKADADSDRTELSIVPARCVAAWVNEGDHVGLRMGAMPTYHESDDRTFSEVIRGENLDVEDTISVAYVIYANPRNIDGSDDVFGRAMGQCISTWNQQNGNVTFQMTPDRDMVYQYPSDWGNHYTLSLRGRKGRTNTDLNNNVKIDTTKLFKISFMSREFMDTTKVYVIRNRNFYCNKLSYRVKDNKISNIVEGEFYVAK